LGPLEEKFKMLDDYSIGLSEEFVLKRRNLREKWSEFCEMLGEIEERNQKVSKDMYYDTNKNLDNFFKETSDFKGHFIGLAPFSMANVDCEKAFQVLNEYRENSKKLRKDEEKMRFGL
jgi:dynein heavy chain